MTLILCWSKRLLGRQFTAGAKLNTIADQLPTCGPANSRWVENCFDVAP